MLAMSDVNVEQFFQVFANTGVPVAFLVPTPNGYGKSIMDATGPVRTLFKNSGLHDYEKQKQGPDAKVMIESYFVAPEKLIETAASVYRPVTKKGDPRIWFKNLRKYCNPCNLLALIIIEGKIYVLNLSLPAVARSLQARGFVYDILCEASHKDSLIADELRRKIQEIHNLGFLPSITFGDPGVGDTLENALGICRNNSKAPDYKGIELKASRLTRNGKVRPTTRGTLFTRVPDEGMTYRQIVDNYGKMQSPKNKFPPEPPRLQIYDTLKVSRPNGYDLVLDVDNNNELLRILHDEETCRRYVSSWYLTKLKEVLLSKHHETFWVKALSENRDGKEYFRYDKIIHTKNPNVSLLAPLIEADKITVDLAAHYNSDGKWRDHGVLFKIKPVDIQLLFTDPIEYDLTLS